jgi:hypothetical protein
MQRPESVTVAIGEVIADVREGLLALAVEVGHGPRVRLADAPAPYGVIRRRRVQDRVGLAPCHPAPGAGGSGNDDDVADHAHVVVDRADVVERAGGGEGDIEGGSWCEGSAVEVATGVVGRVA